MCGLLLALSSVPALAAEEEQVLPSAELLEFLGSFESVDGAWIDPTDFEIPLPGLAAAESGEKSDE
ncbi:MAG TPA: hypothetical protein VGE50_11410 [Gammaproteobacteria bacterium]